MRCYKGCYKGYCQGYYKGYCKGHCKGCYKNSWMLVPQLCDPNAEQPVARTINAKVSLPVKAEALNFKAIKISQAPNP